MDPLNLYISLLDIQRVNDASRYDACAITQRTEPDAARLRKIGIFGYRALSIDHTLLRFPLSLFPFVRQHCRFTCTLSYDRSPRVSCSRVFTRAISRSLDRRAGPRRLSAARTFQTREPTRSSSSSAIPRTGCGLVNALARNH